MIYGSDSSSGQKENLMKVNTLFPSKTSEKGEVKGGIVLVKLKEIYCVLGFPSEEELIIKNFYFNNKNIINNINN